MSFKQSHGGIWFPFSKDTFGCCIEEGQRAYQSYRWDLHLQLLMSSPFSFVRVFLLVPKGQPKLNRKCKAALDLCPDGFLMPVQSGRKEKDTKGSLSLTWWTPTKELSAMWFHNQKLLLSKICYLLFDVTQSRECCNYSWLCLLSCSLSVLYAR